VVADDLTTTGSRADAVLTARAGLALAVHTADCGPVALVGRQTGVVGAVHVGWRGLVAGVLPSALDRFSALGEHDVAAVVGPSICAAHYEFGEAELADVVAAVGSEVAATTPEGRPALDLRAGIRHELVRRGVDVLSVSTRCTAEEPEALYSHRARRDTGRQALVVRREVAP
jgi:hypothetical protein